MGRELVGEEHGLRMLQVGASRHHGTQVGGCLGLQRFKHPVDVLRDETDLGAQI